MASAVQISIWEYMETTYRPDREFVDGELRERNVGKWEHSRVQALLTIWFGQNRKEWSVLAATELRVQVTADRVRIPDVTITTPGPKPDVLIEPPVLVIEILSPDDSYTDTVVRAQDYLKMGVPMVWIIDPKSRTGRMCEGSNWNAAERLTVPSTEIYVDLDAIFSKINDL